MSAQPASSKVTKGATITAQSDSALTTLSRGELTAVSAASQFEWLLTNDIGGYASGTVSGANTRRYHGLLVAALTPPLGRTVMVAKLEVHLEYLGKTYALTSNEFGDGTIDPQGSVHLLEFRLDGRRPVWTYAIGDALIEQRIWMAAGENSTYFQLQVLRSSAVVSCNLTALCTYRDYHSHTQGQGWSLAVHARDNGCEVRAFNGARPYRLTTDQGRFVAQPSWYWNFRHRRESQRGLDDREDLFRVGSFQCTLRTEQSVHLTLSSEEQPQTPADALGQQQRREAELVSVAPTGAPLFIRQLLLAADQFVVQRGAGHSVIAGYPWFGDWGRDTMIALPGLCLATKRYSVAASILRTFATHISDGMLPNRFPDSGESAEYNTVDATLWYFNAIDLYDKSANDPSLVRDLYPVLVDIIDRHERGTRFGICVAPDGLLKAGREGVQLTWMDARVGDRVITPRIGKPVEINALWYQALRIMERFAQRFSDTRSQQRMRTLAERVQDSFATRFFSERDGYLYDVIDTPTGNDASLRPNQIIALAIAPTLVSEQQRRKVVETVAQRLWTPVGLRSLAADHVDYIANYSGGPAERDAAYHQGTVWSWLLGPFVEAHYNTFGDVGAALSYLTPIQHHLKEACVGSISEIFSASAPHAPEGCFAQAWSVAEILRVYLQLTAVSTHDTNSTKGRAA